MQVAPISRAVERLAGAINRQTTATGMITGKNPFLKSFITILLPAQQPADIHDQRQLCQVGGLKSDVDDGKPDPAAAFIQLHSKK